ncbi:MAG: Ig-like domain-containing protein [Spirochaetales bacterium]|nr:Ig-like domain-containing protein [Spirochaetales bacterium]
MGLGDSVDLDSPSISIGEYEDGTAIESGDYVRGTIILNGTVSDDTGIDKVEYSLDDGETYLSADVGSDSQNWSGTIDTTAYEDGEKEIILKVTDKTDKTDETRLLLYFDNTEPIVVVTYPSGYDSTSYTDATISIKGEASDTYRVREVTVDLVGGSGTLSDVEGTSSWSCSFESNGTGAYIFSVTAEDYAGNTSTHFYHYDDILDANDDTSITTEDVYIVENGTDMDNLTTDELSDLELENMTLLISLDEDTPDITISNPDPDATTSDNILSGTPKFIGSVTDDDGVDVDSLEIRFDGGDWEPVTADGSGYFVTWEYSDETYDESGDHYLQFRVDDIYGVSALSDTVYYRINVDAAKVELTSPAMGDYMSTSDFTISGTAEDTGGGITNLQISLDGGSSWADVDTDSSLPTETTDWSYDAVDVDDGTISVKMRASDDNGGSWSYTNSQFTVDTTAPVVSFTSPSEESEVNGDVTLRGTCTDNNSLASVQIKIGNDDWIDIDDDDLYSWSYEFDSNLYENDTHGTETYSGSGSYQVNCYILAKDKAGNTTETEADDYYIYVNNALDKPVVTIISPDEDESVGGVTTVSGTSSDDDGDVYAVYMQIDVNTADGDDPDYADVVELDHGIDFDGDGTLESTIDESAWYEVEGTTPWSVTLNSYSDLYSTEDGHTGDIYLKVYAVDKDGGDDSVSSDVCSLHFRFDDSIPLISDLSPESESYVNGTFTITGDVSDETQIQDLQVSYDGGSNYYYIIEDGTVQTGYSEAGTSVTTDYAINLSVNTTDIPDIGSVTSDDISIRFKVTDDTNYQSQESLVYYVDNILPTSWMTQDTTDIYGTGDNATFYGYADDDGTVSGVEKVVLYIERDDLFYDQKDGSTMDVTYETINSNSVAYPDDEDYLMVIDSTVETLSGSNSDGDSLAEELNIGTYYEWIAQINSENIPDGTATLHYVVFDNAGNQIHSSQTIFVKNDKPSIDSVDVGYDLDKNGTVEGGEIFTYTEQFKARSLLYFNVNATDGGTLSYAIYKGTDTTGTEILSTSTGTIDISDEIDGSLNYYILVTDEDGITAEQLIEVDIDNVDEEDPEVTLDSLTRDSVSEGHLELEGESLYGGTDADVSGTIMFTGTVYDEQGIETFNVQLDGTTTELAAWDSGYFVSQDSNFTIDDQTFDTGTGHEISWTYTWNSAEVTGVAAEDVTVLFTAYDFAPNNHEQSTTFDVVPYISDIETSLTSSFDEYFTRSALGEYPVMINSSDGDYESITINGYNLNPINTGDADSDVRLSIDTDAYDSGSKVGDGLAYTGDSDSTYTSITVDMYTAGGSDLTGGGYLTVFTNDIPSINNTNDNGNIDEGDHINPNLVDDRKLQVWDLNLIKDDFTYAANAVYPSMSMNGDTPEFAYQNNANGWGIALRNDGSSEYMVYENWDLFTFSAFDHNSSGDFVGLYDINVVNGNYGDYNSGNYGGILMNIFEEVPATSWNYWSYRFNDNQIWLENLVDEDSATTAVLDRYSYPDVVVKGDSSNTDLFYSIYDGLKDKIIFRHFQVGSDSSIATSSGGSINDTNSVYVSIDQYVTDGSFPDYDGGDKRFISSNIAGQTPDGRHEVETVNTGEFTAVAATDDASTAVLAWYDASGTGKIRLKYNNDPDDDSSWETIDTDDLIASGTGGEYVDMQIDSSDNIHLAYYDNNNGDLHYIYIPVTSFSTGSFGTIEDVIVDSYFDVGERLTLELDSNDLPVIGYKGVNRSGKMARLVGSPGDAGVVDDEYTGNWEISILPTTITNSDSNRFCIGVDSNDLPVVGYTNDGIEYIRLLDDLAD